MRAALIAMTSGRADRGDAAPGTAGYHMVNAGQDVLEHPSGATIRRRRARTKRLRVQLRSCRADRVRSEPGTHSRTGSLRRCLRAQPSSTPSPSDRARFNSVERPICILLPPAAILALRVARARFQPSLLCERNRGGTHGEIYETQPRGCRRRPGSRRPGGQASVHRGPQCRRRRNRTERGDKPAGEALLQDARKSQHAHPLVWATRQQVLFWKKVGSR
jgi:hypothetical protein